MEQIRFGPAKGGEGQIVLQGPGAAEGNGEPMSEQQFKQDRGTGWISDGDEARRDFEFAMV
jgi:hypothetical protein